MRVVPVPCLKDNYAYLVGLDSTARASFGIYTTHDEIDALTAALIRVREFFT